MKKLISVTLSVATATLFLSGCMASSAKAQVMDKASSNIMKIDVKNECNVEERGAKKVLASASMYNKIAKEQSVEFKRLGMTTTQYIDGTAKALATGSKTVDVLNKKKKKTGTVSTEYAAWRACSFAISALQQKEEAKSTWRLAIPGDGYKY